MKVSKAQAQQNRVHIVETASALFRERGYDGVGVADLMGAAGFTHGGFYKHFGSKADLLAEAVACGLAKSAAQGEGVSLAEFIERYLSRQHRDNRGGGCTMAALSGDAARQPDAIKKRFEGGVEYLAGKFAQDPLFAELDPGLKRQKTLGIVAQVVGAVMLSRACPDESALADEILAACRAQIQASLGKA